MPLEDMEIYLKRDINSHAVAVRVICLTNFQSLRWLSEQWGSHGPSKIPQKNFGRSKEETDAEQPSSTSTPFHDPQSTIRRRQPPSLRLTAQTSHPGSSRAGSSLKQTLYGRLQVPTQGCTALACWWHCNLLAGRTLGTRLGLPASQPPVNLQCATHAQDITAGFALSSC